MKNKLFVFSFLLFACSSVLISQQSSNAPSPPPTPAPPAEPSSKPQPPEAPEPLGAIAPPAIPAAPHKSDTTRISIGDTQIMIIDSDKNSSGKSEKADWEKELQLRMKELKESLKNTKEEMNESREEMEMSKEQMEKLKRIEEEQTQKLKNQAEELKEEAENAENEAPDHRRKLELKLGREHKDHKVASVGFLNFDFGVNILAGSAPEHLKNDLKLKTWGSWSYTFNFLPTKIFLGSRNLMLLTSFGWRLGQLEFTNNIDFTPGADSTLVYHKDDNIKKSQFVIHHLQIPLTLYWKSNKLKGLGDVGFGIGMYAGLLVTQKLDTETSKPNREITTYEDYGFEDFRYGIGTRLDIGAIKLFANFDLNKLWKGNDFKNIECGLWLDL